MMLAWRFALRDLRGGLLGLRLLAICLFLGVAALASVGSLSSAIVAELSARGGSILGGDLQLSVVQRTAEPDELAAFKALGKTSETVRMRAMVSKSDGTANLLIELKGIDDAYPLYGVLRLQPGAIVSRPAGNDIVVAPALAERLTLKPGSMIRIGEAEFRVAGIIADEPDRVGEGFTLGPVAIADMKGIAATKLVQPGSLFTTKYRVLTGARDPAVTGATLVKRFPSGGWEVRDRSNGAPGTRRFVERLGEFLMIVGLTSLVVAGIGVGNGVVSYLEGKRASIATLKALGARSDMIFRTYLIQIVIVTAAAVGAGLVAGALAPWLVKTLAGSALPVAPRIGVYPVPLLTSAAFGLLIAIGFALAPLARARDVTAASLFRGGLEADKRPSWRTIAGIIAVALLIATLAIAMASSPWVAAGFLAAEAGVFVMLTLLGWAVTLIAARLPRPRAPLLRLALGNLHRPGNQTTRLIVALGLGLTLFASLAMIDSNLAGQLERTVPRRAPTFFVLDVPSGDVEQFRAVVAAQSPGATIITVPTLRGPVVAINGIRVADMKNIPDEAWILRGDRGLTFAADLAEGSRIVSGKWWLKGYSGPPLISLDVNAAKILKLKVGDTLTVSVLGVEVAAKIASLREINWDTLGFNFAMIFSPGTLEGAPHSFMATIAMKDAGRELALSNAITQALPSASIIRVKDVITQVGDLFGQLAMAVRLASLVAVTAGIAVLIGAIAAARRARVYDAVILKTLGATRRQIFVSQGLEYGALAVIVSAIALLIGGAGGWYIVTNVLDLDWSPDWGQVLGTTGVGAVLILGLGLLGSYPALSARPAQALRTL
ncbi:MAG: ABC transporter permease [Sphingomonadaceae bacterium]